jgi:hypothetical protein
VLARRCNRSTRRASGTAEATRSLKARPAGVQHASPPTSAAPALLLSLTPASPGPAHPADPLAPQDSGQDDTHFRHPLPASLGILAPADSAYSPLPATLGALYPFADAPALRVPAGGAACAQPSAPCASSEAGKQPPSNKRAAGAAGGSRRQVGRPRVASASAAACPPPQGAPLDPDQQQPKRGRGPKPKYVYQTPGEAADARRDRNRKAALESYYK